MHPLCTRQIYSLQGLLSGYFDPLPYHLAPGIALGSAMVNCQRKTLISSPASSVWLQDGLLRPPPSLSNINQCYPARVTVTTKRKHAIIIPLWNIPFVCVCKL